MLHLDLDEMLERPEWRAQVNHRDTWGRTPLHWAAMRGHAGHVLSLLAAEADVTAKDAWRETPLWKAVRSTSSECVRLLLVAKSRVGVRNIYNQEVIHHAAEKSLPVLKLLLDAGASPECDSSDTPLGWAAMGNCAETCRYLLGLNVRRNVPDWNGNTPVFAAVTCIAHDVLEMLLQEGVDLTHRNKTGSTILHWLARFGNSQTARVMLAANLEGLDPYVRDMEGRTAREVLRDRVNPPSRLPAAFDLLLDQVENRYGEEFGLEEEFFDAHDTFAEETPH